MKVMVFGATGFIGKHLSERLLREGHEVLGVSSHEIFEEFGTKKNYKHIVLDIADVALFRKLPRDYKTVFILSAYIPSKLESRDLNKLFEVNVFGLYNILEFTKEIQAHRIIYSSSASVYGNSMDSSLSEDTSIPQPTSFYGMSKLTGEHIVQYYEMLTGIQSIIFRYSSVYGFGMAGDTVLPCFMQKALKNEDILISNQAAKSRDYVFVDDVVSANVLVLSSQARGIFNIGSGTETTMRQLAQTIIDVTGSRSCIVDSFFPEKPPLRMPLDISKARRGIHYKPLFPLRPGLQKYMRQL